MPDLNQLGKQLEAYRKGRTGLSISAMCRAVRLDRSVYHRLIKKDLPDQDRRPPSEWTLLRFGDVFKLTHKERDALFVLAGYDPAEIPRSVQLPPWSPDADLSEMSDEDLAYWAGVLEGHRQERARRRGATP